ncbi:MAG: type I restriction endonuclease subunit R [Prevotella sp.]|nr:type I restriction endonuclease subunit R [Prevotella sp.]
MPNLLNETKFEEHIAGCLAQGDLYNQRTSADFNIEELCDRGMLERFLRAQSQTWHKLSLAYPGKEMDAVVTEYNKKLNRGESILTILQKGFKIKGIPIKFVQFKPILDGPESPAYELYRQNCFSVVRQMRYSTSTSPYGSRSNESLNELDLCILVNGIPLLTCELKNQGTSQNYGHGIYQYRYERNPENRMLRNCLVHFVMDNFYVFMTTHLRGEDTKFLPFNSNSDNPAIDGDYPTAYMWRHVECTTEADYESNIFGADSLLDIIENFFKRCNDENGNPVIYFPRYHQLRAVRKLRRLVRAEGPGHNYLIEHSAGSGKTKSMAWLAHQLANMANDDKTPVFDSIIMVTDRIVLNRNMADDVVAFETVAGTVKDIRRGAKNLATALNEGHRIIISTVQKFAYALKDLKRDKHRKYAIIVDEAHTAIGNESAKDLVNALSTDEDLENVEGFNREDYDSDMEALMAYMQIMRRHMSHISYFAFTATPKDKTFALFGKDGKMSHDLYSMKQAIDEKFILDVLQNYKSYQTMFEYIEKNPEEDQDELFEEKKSLRVIYSELNKNAYIKLRKANMMLDHFMHHTINKIGHRAKAMVVTDSRQAAADYKQLLDRLIADQYDGKIKTLVAFSGEVTDSHGHKCSEASMNDDHVKDDDIRIKFMNDDYKILVVAEKFQTGFDQKLLHTMYVDRVLGGIQCIQTLSRLNRCCDGKEDTMVIDFRNDVDKVRKAFQEYYTEVTLEGEVDTQRLYSLKDDVEAFKVFNETEVNQVVEALIDPKKVQGVPSMLKAIIDERVAPMRDEDKDKYRKLVNRYVRQYGFMAQLMDFVDADLEKFYVFCKVFYKYLPYTKETLPMEILERIDLNKLRIQMNFEGQLELEDEKQTMKSSRIGEVGQKRDEDKLSIKEILNIVNSPWEQFLDENDKILKQIWDEILVDPEVTDAFNANNTWDILLNIVKDKFDEKIADQIEKYYNFAEVLEREKSLSLTLMRKFVEALAERTGKAAQLVYDESVLKECMIQAMGGILADVCSHVRSLDEFVDELFFVLNQVSIPTLDGVNELIKNNLNNIYTNDQIRLVDKIQCFNSLVTKYEAYLKKLYYLIHDEEVEGQDGKQASLADSIHAFSCLWKLKYGHTEEAQKYSKYLQMLRDWRNDSSHTAPTTSEQEIDAAIQIVVAMYLYVTGNSITDLEMAGYDAEEGKQETPIISLSDSYDEEEQIYDMAAESFIPANELTEEQRIDVLHKSLAQMMNHGGYRASDRTFSKQRHWIAVYRIAADEGFTIDGDFRYFKHIVDGMNLQNCKVVLKSDTLEKNVKGVYDMSFVDWSANGLFGKNLDEYNDIHHCAEVFLQILSDNRPKK